MIKKGNADAVIFTPGAHRAALPLGDHMRQTFTIEGRLPSLNEYIDAERSNRHAAAGMKRNWQKIIRGHLAQYKIKPVAGPVVLFYDYYEPNKRRDKDNISAIAHKFVQDALVEAGIIPGDGWDQISRYYDEFYIDKRHPRIVVEIMEDGRKK